MLNKLKNKEMNIIRVKNMISNRGNDIANQFEIITKKGRFFQSYNSIIAFIPNDRSKKIKLDKFYWDYSRTTGKYRNIFLGEDKKRTEKKISNKTYQLTNLNK
tara:strand:- start:180 stop:488 length:309 start_codon:yes stop_codon:yes gene_type:complete